MVLLKARLLVSRQMVFNDESLLRRRGREGENGIRRGAPSWADAQPAGVIVKPSSKAKRPQRRLAAFAARGRFQTVIRCFLRNGDVMWVTFSYTRR